VYAHKRGLDARSGRVHVQHMQWSEAILVGMFELSWLLGMLCGGTWVHVHGAALYVGVAPVAASVAAAPAAEDVVGVS